MFLFRGAAITSDYFTLAIARPLTWVRCMIRREFVECVASMLGAAIVPWDEIVDSPDVLSGELGLIDEAPQLVEQRLGSASSSPTK
jgi:hypothetical protein